VIQKGAKLFSSCQKLLFSGDCLDLPWEIIERLIIRFHERNETDFDWQSLEVRSKLWEEEIARQEVIDDGLASEQLVQSRTLQKDFNRRLDPARLAFDKRFRGASVKDFPPLRDFLMQTEEEPQFWCLAEELFQQAAQTRPESVRDFVDRCPPFRAWLLVHWAAGHERLVRGRTTVSARAGLFDLAMAVYLP
jgi:hypothetical protein